MPLPLWDDPSPLWDDPVGRELGMELSQEFTPEPLYGLPSMPSVQAVVSEEAQAGPQMLPLTGILHAEEAETEAAQLCDVLKSLHDILQKTLTNKRAQSMLPPQRYALFSTVKNMELGLDTFKSGLENMQILLRNDIHVQAVQQREALRTLTHLFQHLEILLHGMIDTKQAITHMELTEFYLQTAYNALHEAKQRLHKDTPQSVCAMSADRSVGKLGMQASGKRKFNPS